MGWLSGLNEEELRKKHRELRDKMSEIEAELYLREEKEYKKKNEV